jgi:DNA-binding NarL/FixJ family response regulator
MIKVLLADDHLMFREGLKQLLSDASGIKVAGEASNTGEVMSQVQKEDYNVIVLDISMPGRDGIDILDELKRDGYHVLILSMYPEDQYAVRAFKLGAAGYLTKSRATEELVEAIRTIAGGSRYISKEVAEQLVLDLENDSKKLPHDRLSNREYQVMCMIASGRSVKEIANELSLSISTISTNRARILHKMEMKNNSELTYYAIKYGLVK